MSSESPPEVVQPKVELVLQSQCVSQTFFALDESVATLEELVTEHSGTAISDLDQMGGIPATIRAINRAMVLIDLLGAGLAKQEGRLWPHGTVISGGRDST